MTDRHQDWEQRLNDYIAKAADPGDAIHQAEDPCGKWAIGAVLAVTGHRLALRYTSSRDAKRLIVKHGGTLEKLVDAHLTPLDAPAFAQRGDIIMDSEGILGVCFGKYALAVGETPDGPGLVRVLMHEWKKAWRVG